MVNAWDVKLNRAEELLVELRREIRLLLASGAFYVETEPEGTERAVRMTLKGEIPPRLSAIVGDVLHNLRSSLDTVALAACEAGSEAPLTEKEERQVQFPITDSRYDFEKAVGRLLPYATDYVVSFIRSRQPWHDVETADMSEERRASAIEHDQLSTLQRLSNIDKHRRLHLAAWVPIDIMAGVGDGVEVTWKPNRLGRPPQDGDVIGWWLLSEDREFFPQAQVQVALDYHLGLGWTNQSVDGFLENLIRYVRGWVVGPLANIISSGASC